MAVQSAGSKTGVSTVASVIVQCLEQEGVEYIFGIPGEENIQIVDAISQSKIGLS